MNNREQADLLIAELFQHGITEYRVDDSGNHNRLYYRVNGRERFFVFPSTPGDRKGQLNSLCDLRRALGVKRIVRKSTRPKRRRERRAEPVRVESFTLLPNGFDALPDLLHPAHDACERIEARTMLALYRLSFFPGDFKTWAKLRAEGCA